MTDLTRAEIEGVAYNFSPQAVDVMLQLLAQLDAANAKAAEEQALFGRMAEMCDHIQAQLDAANARLGAALREAADPELLSRGLRSGAHDMVIDAVRNNILALAPDATAALDRALEQMRERCVKLLKADAEQTRAEADPDELEYWAVKQMQFAAGALDFAAGKIAALPLHEELNNVEL